MGGGHIFSRSMVRDEKRYNWQDHTHMTTVQYVSNET